MYICEITEVLKRVYRSGSSHIDSGIDPSFRVFLFLSVDSSHVWQN